MGYSHKIFEEILNIRMCRKTSVKMVFVTLCFSENCLKFQYAKTQLTLNACESCLYASNFFEIMQNILRKVPRMNMISISSKLFCKCCYDLKYIM